MTLPCGGRGRAASASTLGASESGSSTKAMRDIVVVIGTTGVGKSDLAVALAKSLSPATSASPTTPALQATLPHSSAADTSTSSPPRTSSTFTPTPISTAISTPYNKGVILSADSMQLYKGLDVITNKITPSEMGGVEHWGLDLVQPGQGGSWEVGRWCGEADNKVRSLEGGTLPIVCGGTHYFVQHYLFPPDELNFERPELGEGGAGGKGKGRAGGGGGEEGAKVEMRWTPPRPRPDLSADFDPELENLLETFWTPTPALPKDLAATMNTDEARAGPSRSSRPTTTDDHELLSLHRLLVALDPKEGARWHWRDGRKVRRGIERWWENGGVVSVDREAGDGVRSQGKGRRARFRTLIFWVYEPLEALRPRLDKRVDKMVDRGLLKEIAELRDIAKRVYGSTEATDHTEGIFQSIGYKEFSALDLSQPDPTSDPLFPSMLDRMKLSTHQYAKSQLKWIKKQLLPAVREARALKGDVGVYVVHGGQGGVDPALGVLRAFLQGEELPDPAVVGHEDAADLLAVLEEGDEKVPDTADRQEINARKNCETCSTPLRPYSVSVKEWDRHLKSKIHYRNSRPVRDKAQWIAAQQERGEAIRAQRQRLHSPSIVDGEGET